MAEIFTRSIKKGFRVSWELVIKIVLPVYIIVSLLNYTPVIPWLSRAMAPVMGLLGLPGEAALPLVLGALVNYYAGLGALIPLGLSVKELTIAAAIILIAHDLPLEAAVSKKSGSKFISLILARIVLACFMGAGINFIL
jgi:spore maturation protein SpmB